MARSEVEASHRVDDALLEPWRYLMGVPGKNVRGMLIHAFQVWLKIPEDNISQIQDIVTNLHTASLLMDDVEDNSRLRRGVPVAHKIYGVANTINCANYVYFLALENCVKLRGDGKEKALRVFVAELLNLHRGQGQDILWRDSGHCPTEDEYRAMVIDKTGGLFRLSVGLMQAFSANDTDYTPLVNLLALYFQIRDDYVNLASHAYMQHKSFCEDITEGKFSFPVIHCIHHEPADHRLRNILRQRTGDVELKLHAVERLRQTGSLRYTRAKLDELVTAAKSEIARLGGHSDLDALIDTLHSQVADCTEGDTGGYGDGGCGEKRDKITADLVASATPHVDESMDQIARAAHTEKQVRSSSSSSPGTVQAQGSPLLGTRTQLSGVQAAAAAAATLEPPLPPVVGLKRMDSLS